MIEDPELIRLSNLMSEIIAVQMMCQSVKQEGRSFPELDEYLVQMVRASDVVVAAMNKRIVELHGND